MSWAKRCRDYVESRQSRDGGFCFYGSDYIEESNLYDTGFALATLRALRVEPPRRSELASWLSAQQETLGEGGSLAALWSWERSMRLLGLTSPEAAGTIEPSPFDFPLPSRDQLRSWDAGELLRDLVRLAEIASWKCRSPSPSWRERLAELLEALRGESGAFPRGEETLVGSWQAFTVARTFAIRIPESPLLAFAQDRLASAETRGFLSTEAQSLEGVRSGLELLAAFGRPLEGRPKATLALQVVACQSASGGFGRRIDAIPTLEDSFYGARALLLLEGTPSPAGDP